MRTNLAVLIDGRLFNPEGQQISPAEPRADEAREVAPTNRHHVIDVPRGDGVELIVALLANIVKLTRELSPADQRRARGFLATTGSVLSASGYLGQDDQQIFEAALRSAVRCDQ